MNPIVSDFLTITLLVGVGLLILYALRLFIFSKGTCAGVSLLSAMVVTFACFEFAFFTDQEHMLAPDNIKLLSIIGVYMALSFCYKNECMNWNNFLHFVEAVAVAAGFLLLMIGVKMGGFLIPNLPIIATGGIVFFIGVCYLAGEYFHIHNEGYWLIAWYNERYEN
ncbi:MAG: hypothetical protein IJW96_01090 [Clostridia bacterium]|nr:hypothetical protein [Clostridia bacterium]